MASKSASRRRSKQSPGGQELLALELQAIQSAETQLARVLPRLSRAVESEQVREMLEERLGEGERLLQEVESALDELEQSPGRRKNVAAEGLINDTREYLQEIAAGPSLDAVLIAALQKTEHYCIAAWGTAKALARAMDQTSAARAMERALKEGSKFDERLTEIAEQEIMPALLGTEEEEAEEPVRSRRRRGSERRPHA